MLILQDTLIVVEGILGRKHRQWSVTEKRRIVAEANQPGTTKAKSTVLSRLSVIVSAVAGGTIKQKRIIIKISCFIYLLPIFKDRLINRV